MDIETATWAFAVGVTFAACVSVSLGIRRSTGSWNGGWIVTAQVVASHAFGLWRADRHGSTVGLLWFVALFWTSALVLTKGRVDRLLSREYVSSISPRGCKIEMPESAARGRVFLTAGLLTLVLAFLLPSRFGL